MFNIGTEELLVILLVALLLFGARRIPEIARALGKGLGDFRDALSGVERQLTGEPPRPGAPKPPPALLPFPESVPREVTSTPRPAAAGEAGAPAPGEEAPTPPAPAQEGDRRGAPQEQDAEHGPESGSGLAG